MLSSNINVPPSSPQTDIPYSHIINNWYIKMFKQNRWSKFIMFYTVSDSQIKWSLVSANEEQMKS